MCTTYSVIFSFRMISNPIACTSSYGRDVGGPNLSQVRNWGLERKDWDVSISEFT